MAILSQSGSVAMSRSASFTQLYWVFECLLVSSGLGYSMVGKVSSGSSCSFTTYTFLKPLSERILLTRMFPAPLSGVYYLYILVQGFVALFICAFAFARNSSSISLPMYSRSPFSRAYCSVYFSFSARYLTSQSSLCCLFQRVWGLWCHPLSGCLPCQYIPCSRCSFLDCGLRSHLFPPAAPSLLVAKLSSGGPRGHQRHMTWFRVKPEPARLSARIPLRTACSQMRQLPFAANSSPNDFMTFAGMRL